MKSIHVLRRWWPAALLAALFLAAPVHAQERVALYSVEPRGGEPGQRLDLTLRGRGFGGRAEVTVGEMQAQSVQVESDQVIRAQLSIPSSAQPGPRDVEVVVDLGGRQETFRARLAGGFTIWAAQGGDDGGGDEGGGDEGGGNEGGGDERGGDERGGDEGGGDERGGDERGGDERGGDDERMREDEHDGGVDWPTWIVVLLVGAAALAGAAVAVTVTLRLRRSAQRARWQNEAREGQLPDTCQHGTYHTVREQPEIKPGRWKVTSVRVTLYDAAGSRRGESRNAPSEIVGRIDRAARDRLLGGDAEQLAVQAKGVARGLAALVVGWQEVSQVGRDVYLEPQIEGGEASVTFKRYRCTGTPGRWFKIAEWTAKLQAARHLPRTFRGPVAGEDAAAYRRWLETQFAAHVGELIQNAGQLA